MPYEAVIGLEVHTHIKTKSKLFCACPVTYGADANRYICPVCTGQPGALPVLNRAAVEQALRAALATNCRINLKSVFARKNYFYPDLPKAYQISQFEEPLCEQGFVEITLANDQRKKIRLTRIHIEEDAGKIVHQGAAGILGAHSSQVDLNRSSVPLLEIVSEPDLRSATEARLFLESLKLILKNTTVSDADMEKGQLRADVNVSLRPRGATAYGTRAEIKNMNSFRSIEKAINYEINRQTAILAEGGKIVQETRNYDDDTAITTSLRDKEEAHDYRYFPEPDLLPLIIDPAWLARVKQNLPELPEAKKARFMTVLGLSDYDAAVLIHNQPLCAFFEDTLTLGVAAKPLCNWLTTDITAWLKSHDQELGNSQLTPVLLAELIALIENKTISTKIAKEILPEMLAKGTSAKQAIEAAGGGQITDEGQLRVILQELIAKHHCQADQLRAGEQKLRGFFMGQVMHRTQGRANPGLVQKLLGELLG